MQIQDGFLSSGQSMVTINQAINGHKNPFEINAMFLAPQRMPRHHDTTQHNAIKHNTTSRTPQTGRENGSMVVSVVGNGG